MATLVLSTVGTALGGPVGGAVGALIGQSLDQQLLAPASRGPRLGDLAVQTSSYGTEIPRIYGTMRVAGSVVWATDLVESEQTTGAKGQPDVTFSYSVSIAVALSSRPIRSIGRIWADGKLLRGAAGDFKVTTTFRLYDGGEDQPVDPLIGSIEGIGNAPAYRGLAVAVFENLELAAFGNRIPFLTFEVIADDAPPAIGAILLEASRGAIAVNAEQTIGGYAAYGSSIKTAVDRLVECYGLELFDDGVQVRTAGTGPPLQVSRQALGNSPDQQKTSTFRREQLPVRALPGILRLSFYDPQRDYQTGEARAAAGEQDSDEVRAELPAAIGASEAKSLAHDMLARTWSQRDKLTLRLPPCFLGLEPGQLVELEAAPKLWTIQKCTIDSFVIIATLHPALAAAASVPADSGRNVSNADVVAGPLVLALMDVPELTVSSTGGPVLLLAASSPSLGWKRVPINIDAGGRTTIVATSPRKSLLGRCLTLLADGPAELLDMTNSIDVELVDPDQWLTSCTDEALAAGANVAVVGGELLQFGSAIPLSTGKFRLSRLLRGRRGTEWTTSGHGPDETFCLLEPETLRSVALADFAVGSIATATGPNGLGSSRQLSGEAMRPPAPTNLYGEVQANGDLSLAWVRRSRRGWAWVDEMDAPLGEAREEYRITVIGVNSSAEFVATAPALTVPRASLSALSPGQISILVRQVGDTAVSRAAELSMNLS